MNKSGCPDGLAHDNFFLFGQDRDTIQGQCILSIPFFIAFYILAALLQFAVAVLRTQVIVGRKGASRREYKRLGWRQWLSLSQTWGAFFTVTAVLIVPLIVDRFPSQGMIVLLGFVSLFYYIAAQTWMYKLVRLGSRIIDPKQAISELKEFDAALKKQDTFLKILIQSINVAITVQLICMLILAPIFPENKLWLLLGIGLMSYTTAADLVAHIYQYQRCKNAVLLMRKRVQGLVAESKRDSDFDAVLIKFTRHQMILTSLGTPATIFFLFWAVELIPTNSYMIFTVVFFDVCTNASMFFTYILRSRRKHNSSSIASSGNKAGRALATGPGGTTANDGSVVISMTDQRDSVRKA